MKKLFLFISYFFLFVIIAGCTTQPPTVAIPSVTPTPCIGTAITIGEIAEFVGTVKVDSQPLADYLAGKLNAFGIECGNVEVVRTVNEMIALINDRQVDIYFDSLFPATRVSNATGAEPILRRWRNCDPEYYSVIVTTANSGINSIEDLPGHMVGMDTPDSTSGLVLPATFLLDQGFKLIVQNQVNSSVAAGEIGIYFTYGDSNTRALLEAGKISAGATDDFHFNNWQKDAPGRFIELAHTLPVLRQVVLVRADLPVELQAAIKDVLINAELDAEGKQAMSIGVDTCKFDDPPELMENYTQMLDAYPRISDIQGWLPVFQK